MNMKNLLFTIGLLVLPLHGSAQEQLIPIKLVSDKRVFACQKKMSHDLDRYNMIRKGVMLASGLLFAYGVYQFGDAGFHWAKWIYATVPVTLGITPASTVAADVVQKTCLGNCNGQKDEKNGWLYLGRYIACAVVQGLAQEAVSKSLSCYAQEQTLTWYLSNKNPYFFSFYALQLSAQSLERSIFDVSSKIELIKSCNLLVDKTESLLAYMHYKAARLPKEKLTQVNEVSATIINKTNLFLSHVQFLLKNNSYSTMVKLINALNDEIKIALSTFATIEGSALEWQRHLCALNGRFIEQLDCYVH